MINGIFGSQFAGMFGTRQAEPPWVTGSGGAAREIRPRLDHDSCDICGRTLLTGETAGIFTSNEFDGHLRVCDTCRDTARNSGFKKVA